MLIPVSRRNGLIHFDLLCDVCREKINEADFPSATVDFSPIPRAGVKHASAERLADAASVRHYHAQCCPSRCTGSVWQKADRVMYPMVANVFNSKNGTVSEAAMRVRKQMTPDLRFP